MKIGDLVKLSPERWGTHQTAGIIVEFIEKKCWRTDVFGNKIDWEKIAPEPHAVVIVRGDDIIIPVIDLEVVSEGV